jgi:hypothetical protein
MLQLLQSASPLTTHGAAAAAAAAGMLRRLAPTDLTRLLGSQIRGFAAEVASASDVQVGAARVRAAGSLQTEQKLKQPNAMTFKLSS